MKERVVLYTRKDCYLCDNARDLVQEVCADMGVGWREVDIDSDALVRARLSDLTPVVEVDGQQVGYWRIRPELVRLALETSTGVEGDRAVGGQ